MPGKRLEDPAAQERETIPKFEDTTHWPTSLGCSSRILPACVRTTSNGYCNRRQFAQLRITVAIVNKPWVRTEDYWTTRWDLNRAIKNRLDAEGIEIPFPQRVVTLLNPDAPVRPVFEAQQEKPAGKMQPNPEG